MGWRDKFHRERKTEKVLLVVLCGNHQAHASLLQMANELDRFSAIRTHRFEFEFSPITAAPQELARNTACGMALEKLTRPTDTLVMIDNDMIQYGWRSLRLLDTPDYDIAGGLQYMWFPRDHTENRPPHAWPCVFERKAEGEKGMTALYPKPDETSREVDRVGSGFIAIKRRVLADERMLLAPGCDPPALWRNVFQPNFVRTRGLDMDFCDRAKALGYRIVVNWSAEMGHNKIANINEIDEYAKSQFLSGFETGVRHAIQVARGQGGAEAGSSGQPGPGQRVDAEMAGVGVDRTGGEAEGAA